MPKRVRSSPVSESTGIRVPMAVVASADPTYTSDTTTPRMASVPPSTYAIASDIAQPNRASLSGSPRMRAMSIS